MCILLIVNFLILTYIEKVFLEVPSVFMLNTIIKLIISWGMTYVMLVYSPNIYYKTIVTIAATLILLFLLVPIHGLTI
ncbi:hypothetical protein AOP6_0365 [Desulfuromonas sp. AOP6]|nr:hypothetical protein AOP6_0365 [Desulfuromonas sp. AOP6]